MIVGLSFFSIVSGADSLDSFNGNFFEGFESGSLATNNWTTSGTGAAWVIGNGEATPRTGVYNIWTENTGAESLIEMEVDTTNYQNINFSFWGMTTNMDAGEYVAADWYNGTSWVNLMQIEDISSYTFYSYNLTTDANNNLNFKIRFKCLSNANNEACDVDDVNVSGTEIVSIVLDDYYGLNGSLARIDGFNTINLEEIEHIELNFSVDSTETIDSWYLNFTANGTNGCSLGNKQSQICYAYPNWIQFVNNSETTTFDEAQMNTGDGIVVTQTSSGNNINLSFRLDEHYNPNVFKWYDALYNFSDIKWQEGVLQKITGDNFIKIELNKSLIPINADQYKLDFRVNATNNPTQPLEVYACNSSYTSGNVHDLPECLFVAEKVSSEFKDDGTKFRTIYTNSTINSIGDIKYIILYTDETNASKYYALKTYRARTPAYTTHWEYSNDSGDNWTNLGDGYETELNVNWFYNYIEPTAFIYNLWVNTTSSVETNLMGNITWNIDPTYNYPPAPHFRHPENNESLKFPYDVIFSMTDPNDDNLNASLYLYKDGAWNATFATGMNQSNTSYYWDDLTINGNYELVLETCELGTPELYCVNTTNAIVIDNTAPAVYDLIPTGGGSSGCIYDRDYDWECGEWGECIRGIQSRFCKKYNNCGNIYGRPGVERNCVKKTLPEQLFDITFNLEDILIQNTDELSGIVTFESFGTIPTFVNLTFIILNEHGNEIYRTPSNITVITEEVLRWNYKDLELNEGKYIAILETLYNVDVHDEFKQGFEIKEKFDLIVWIWYIVITVGVISISLFIKRRRETKKKAKESFIKRI
ncbi:hypothetical protein KAS08_02200 [Candidatus Pacearchaeota archaeon]|nr:hypothetical protein [Candidatus Pacearchaeota archaeon]